MQKTTKDTSQSNVPLVCEHKFNQGLKTITAILYATCNIVCSTHNKTIKGFVFIIINLLLHSREIHGFLDDGGVAWCKVIIDGPSKELVWVSFL